MGRQEGLYPSEEQQTPRDTDPHEVTKRVMQDLRNTPWQLSSIKKRLRSEWGEFYKTSKKSAIEINYLLSRSEFDLIHGTLMHVMWSDLVRNDFLPTLQSNESNIPEDVSMDDGYYLSGATKREYEKGGPYDMFIRSMKAKAEKASERMFREIEMNENYPYRIVWQEYPAALGRLKTAHDQWDTVRDPEHTQSQVKPDDLTPKKLWYEGICVNIHAVMENLLYRKLAHKNSLVDPAAMTKLALADVAQLVLPAHITGHKPIQQISPWSAAVLGIFGEEMIMYDPIANFDERLVEVANDSSLPTCRWKHKMIKESTSKKKGFCPGRFAANSPDPLDQESVQEVFEIVDDYVSLRPPRLGDGSGRFDMTTMIIVLGAYTARETFYQGHFPVK